MSKMLEELFLISGLLMVQCAYALTPILQDYFMSIGVTNLSLVTFSAFATFLLLAPLCLYFERSQWPKKHTLKLSIQLFSISFAGVTLFQTFILNGIRLTSPAIATAMLNLAPGFIFVIACTFRLEKMKFNCIYSKVKIIGTIVCVIGALMMSIFQSSVSVVQTSSSTFDLFDKYKIIGCVYLFAAVFTLSSNIVLLAATLKDFPAPMSLCAVTSLIGVFLTIVVQLIKDHKQVKTIWPPLSMSGRLLAYSILGGTISGATLSINGWAMKKRGPVVVAIFSPVSTIISIIVSIISLGDTIRLGSIAGMCLMFTGLYSVLWAKGKEDFPTDKISENEFDLEKPLLS